MSIPKDGNFKDLSCQLGGLRLNGIVNYSDVIPPVTSGTAQSLTFVTIDDPDALLSFDSEKLSVKGYLKVKIGKNDYFLPLYQ
jgi:hypothetical protein